MINTITTEGRVGRQVRSSQRSLEVVLRKGGSGAGWMYFGM